VVGQAIMPRPTVLALCFPSQSSYVSLGSHSPHRPLASSSVTTFEVPLLASRATKAVEALEVVEASLKALERVGMVGHRCRKKEETTDLAAQIHVKV